jgi:penicillin-binding protein 2
MTELRNIQREPSASASACAAAAAFVLLLRAADRPAGGAAGGPPRRTLHPGRGQPHRGAAHRAHRGRILDRNGVVLATNYSAYTLEITPSGGQLEQTIDQLAQLIDIQPRDRKRFKRLMEESKSFESLPIRTKLTDEEWPASSPSASASPAWTSRRGCSATTRWATPPATCWATSAASTRPKTAMED